MTPIARTTRLRTAMYKDTVFLRWFLDLFNRAILAFPEVRPVTCYKSWLLEQWGGVGDFSAYRDFINENDPYYELTSILQRIPVVTAEVTGVVKGFKETELAWVDLERIIGYGVFPLLDENRDLPDLILQFVRSFLSGGELAYPHTMDDTYDEYGLLEHLDSAFAHVATKTRVLPVTLDVIGTAGDPYLQLPLREEIKIYALYQLGRTYTPVVIKNRDNIDLSTAFPHLLETF